MSPRVRHSESQSSPGSGLAAEVGKQRPFASKTQEAHLNLLRTADAVFSGAQELLKSHGLSRSLYNALRITVAGGRDGVPVRRIGDHMIVREPDVSRLVDRLEACGLVERERCTEDRRVVHVRATPAGSRKAKALIKPMAALYDAQLGHLTDRELETLNELLVKARRPPNEH